MGAHHNHEIRPTVSSGYLGSIFRSAVSFGVEKNVLESILGGPETLLEISSRRFPYETLLSIFEHAAQTLEDPAIGLRFGRNVRAERRIDTIYATTFCADLRSAIQLNIDYQPLIHTMGRTRMAQQGEQVIIGYDPVIPNSEGHRIFIDAMFTSYISIGQWLAWSMKSPVTQIRFQQASPVNTDVYQDIFQCDITFGAERNEIELSDRIINAKIPGQNSEILGKLKLILDKKMELLSEPFEFSEDVKSVIEGNLKSGSVDITTICDQLHISERTLRRRLNKVGVNYSDLLRSVREEQARIFMLDKNMSLSQIAQDLGFHDQSAFSRAFKSWTSETPQSFRKRAVSA